MEGTSGGEASVTSAVCVTVFYSHACDHGVCRFFGINQLKLKQSSKFRAKIPCHMAQTEPTREKPGRGESKNQACISQKLR